MVADAALLNAGLWRSVHEGTRSVPAFNSQGRGRRTAPLARKHQARSGGSRYITSDECPPKILFVTSELTDFVKAGGLGDVSAALPRALRQANDVRIVIPGYRQVTNGRSIRVVARLGSVYGMPACEIGRIDMTDGLTIYVVLCPELYDREGSPYGDAEGVDWPDNDVRFGRLGLAAAEIACGVPDLEWKPDLLHTNDWPAALAPAYLAWRERKFPSVLTIHNLAHQGLFGRERMPDLGIPEHAFQMNGVEFYGRLSFLKAGIFYSSHVTTVSSTYAREITTPEYGCGLEGLLQTVAARDGLSGILNGVDESWDSGRDPHLVSSFDINDLSGKDANAAEVRQAFNLAVSRGPLFAIMSRLVQQKGIDVAIAAAEDVVAQGGQIAVMGKGEPEIETALTRLTERHPGAIGVRIGFDEADSRCLFAGSDFLLMPSRFEPCGLSQQYAQRYGSLPVAYRTGGLADTIEDGVTGFLFDDLSPSGLMHGVKRAFQSFECKSRLKAMRKAAMRRPVSWQHSARRYGGIYERLLGSGNSWPTEPGNDNTPGTLVAAQMSG
jgi:starch synthase